MKNDKLFGYYIKLGTNAFVEVCEGESADVGNINHLAIQVDAIDKVINRLKAHGYVVGKESMTRGRSGQPIPTA